MDSDEPGTLGRLKLATRWNHISNVSDVIKTSGKFEDHRQFLDGVGTQFLVEAIGTTLREVIENGEVIQQTKQGAILLFEKILNNNSINLFPDPTNNPTKPTNNPTTPTNFATNHYDDLAKYASDVASRTLLSLVMRHAEREGNFQAILALKIILVTFFFNVSGLNSQYAPTLMFDIVDYFGASSATRRRMEAMSTANLSGKAGHNIHVDKMCEQFIREVKTILMNLHRGFSEALIDTVIAASNPMRCHISCSTSRALPLLFLPLMRSTSSSRYQLFCTLASLAPLHLNASCSTYSSTPLAPHIAHRLSCSTFSSLPLLLHL